MSIERKAISALKWASASKLVIQVASWAGTLVVVRLLTPQDYGLMAKVAVVCGIVGTIAELGLEAAIVRTVDLLRDDVRKVFGVSLVFALAGTGLVIGSAPLLARLLHEPRLEGPIAAASLQIVIAAIGLVPSALAVRDLSFRSLAKIDMAAGLTGVVATLLLAWEGAGVWALVAGNLLVSSVRSTALLASGPRVWPSFSPRGIGEHLKFGLTLMGNRLSYFVVVQSDVLIGSAFLSTTEIGRYAVALQLATLPMTKVMGTINQIALPAVARQQQEPERVRQTVLKSVGLISLLAFPVLWGISALAPELVRVLLGSNWLEAVPALTILPLIVPLRMALGVLFTASLAMGNRQIDLLSTTANFVLLPGGFYVGAHWGLLGLCSAWLVSVPLAYAVSLPLVLRAMGIRARELVIEFAAPAMAAGGMYAAIATLRPAVAALPALVALVALSAVGGLLYLALMGLFSRRHLAIARNFGRSLLARDAPTLV